MIPVTCTQIFFLVLRFHHIIIIIIIMVYSTLLAPVSILKGISSKTHDEPGSEAVRPIVKYIFHYTTI